MANLLYIGTNGAENPTKSVLPFLSAIGAVEAGHQATIYLTGDAVVLMREAVVNSVIPVGWPPLKDLLAKVVEFNVPIYV